MNEYLDVVDDSDCVIGKATRKEVYEKKLTHRIVHVLVINPINSKIYIQKRADSVSYLPGHYSTSAGGHVLSGESYDQAVARELNEELGIKALIKNIASMSFFQDGQKRFIQLFLVFAEA